MDKALILYQGQPMYQYAAKLIEPFCKEVIISCRKEQEESLIGYPLLLDGLPSKGPLTGLLSAFLQHPNVAWLLIPVDMPNLTTQFVQEFLISNRDSQRDATILCDQLTSTIQPLVAIYEPACFKKIQEQYENGLYSLKDLVDKLQVYFVDFMDNEQYLANYNNPEDWSAIQNLH